MHLAAGGARLDDAELDGAVVQYCEQALAVSTQKSYASAKRRYLQFCARYHIQSTPFTEQALCKYVAYLANQRVSHTSIKCYLAALRHLHIERELGDPNISMMPKLELVIRGVRRAQSVNKKPSLRQPITPGLLSKMRQTWLVRHKSWDGRMLWAASTLCFFGFLRSGEITVPDDSSFNDTSHLTFEDVAVDRLDSPRMLKVHLKQSKTDPFRLGVDIVVGKVDGPLCPVQAMLSYLGARGGAAGPLFRFQDGRPLTRTRFVSQVRTRVIVFGAEQRRQQHRRASRTPSLKLWEDGRAMRTTSTSRHQRNNWHISNCLAKGD